MTASGNECAVNTYIQKVIMQNVGKTETLAVVSPEF